MSETQSCFKLLCHTKFSAITEVNSNYIAMF